MGSVPPATEGAQLDGAVASPALVEAQRVTSAAAEVGFDWPAVAPVRSKLDEELEELDQAIRDGERANIREELGDVLLTLVNLARHLDVDAEQSLAAATAKFSRRLAAVDRALARRGTALTEASMTQMQAAWEQAKLEEVECSSG